MNIRQVIMIALLALVGTQAGWAKEPEGVQRRPSGGFRVSSDCLPSSASEQLDVNNIRALLHNGGDMWWDLVGDPRYEVPKGSNRHSMFASSLWIGGLDDAGQLRIAAQTYRQSGNDFWPGPLSGGATGGEAATDAATCEKFDRMFKINKTEIDAFRADWSDGVLDNAANYPNVFGWPALGSPLALDRDKDGLLLEAFRPDGSILYAAPFVNVDSDPFAYNPESGDYPDIQGDQAIWWIINDRGNVHTETGGEPIGIEIHMLAFAFTTANAVNDMTFYRQTVVNRSSLVLNDTYLGQWVDADLGKFNDDYVGCDTLRGLGYCYNADNNDDGPAGYGLNPPAIGVDFFQGPLADPNDGVDNDKDGLLDEPGETIIMSKFVYYNNDFSLVGNPEVAQHFYGYLTGFWKDGTPIVDNFSNGGDGTGYGVRSPGPVTNYMFPGDPCTGVGWTEDNADNPRNEDRRFLQSAGPFTLQPGAVNEIITGAVWARGFFNDQFGSICELQSADDIAQALFDNNFRLLDGPDAPQMEVSELNEELLITWGYPEALRNVRNNYNEGYRQADPVLKARGIADSVFEFQGYVVYQLIDATVGPNELNDPDRARVVAQCDIIDGVGTIVNRVEQRVEGLSTPIIVDQVMVQGSDEGITHSVQVTKDLFAQGDETRLRNYTTYYYAVIAYAYNQTTSDGRQFVPGNRFFQVVPALPHPPEIERTGTVINSSYGDGLPISQVGGIGNGGKFVRITTESEQAILSNSQPGVVGYQPGAAPIDVKIVDPKRVKPRYYRMLVTGDSLLEAKVLFTDPSSGAQVIDSTFAEWLLFESEQANGPFTQIYAATYVKRNDGSAARPAPLVGTERVIEDRGFSIAIRDVGPSGDTLDIPGTGVIGGEISFADPNRPWLTGVADNNDFGGGVWDWLRNDDASTFRSDFIYDKFGDFQRIASGRWGPFAMARAFNNSSTGGSISPGLTVGNPSNNRQVSPSELVNLRELPDVDIVFTSDISKWSRCVIVETSPNSALGTGAWQLSAKYKASVNQDGSRESNIEPAAGGPYGMGWFPGYAINVSTGQRLNIFFGESEWDKLNNGDDMLFNPGSNLGTNLDRVGGRHYVYVTQLPYDGCESIKNILFNANFSGIGGFSNAIFFNETQNNLKDAYKHVAWVGIPYAATGFEFDDPRNIPTEARVSLRVKQPFRPRPGVAGDRPEFTFNTIGRDVQVNQTEVAQNALDLIRVVPNPYYAYNTYETGQLDNRVKITNLPQQCRISIFTLNGYLIRQFNKDSDAPDQDWDLKNESGVPVASGVYIVHIDANIGEQRLGEKVVKMFAVMRQLDLDNF